MGLRAAAICHAQGVFGAKATIAAVNGAVGDAAAIAGAFGTGKADIAAATFGGAPRGTSAPGQTILPPGAGVATTAIIQIGIALLAIPAAAIAQATCAIGAANPRASAIRPAAPALAVIGTVGNRYDQIVQFSGLVGGLVKPKEPGLWHWGIVSRRLFLDAIGPVQLFEKTQKVVLTGTGLGKGALNQNQQCAHQSDD